MDLDRALEDALEKGSVRDAADDVAARLDLPRRKVYQRALQLAAGHEPSAPQDGPSEGD